MRRKQRLKDKAKKLREKDIERRRRELVKEREKKAEEKRKEKEAAKAEMDEEEEVCLCYLHSSMFNMSNVKTADHSKSFLKVATRIKKSDTFYWLICNLTMM